jgi:hypothetical protein
LNINRIRILFLVFVLVAGMLSGCASNKQSEELSLEFSKETTESIGTGGQLIAIQSDNVSAAGYNDSSMVMTVRFDSGALYEYYNVPPELWTAFVAAQPHPWSQIGYPRLVQGGIPYRRIG